MRDITNADQTLSQILRTEIPKFQSVSDDSGMIGGFHNIKEISAGIVDNSADYSYALRNIEPVLIRNSAIVNDIGYDSVGLQLNNDVILPLSSFGLQSYSTLTGVSVGYAKKCLLAGKADLLLDNYRSWHQSLDPNKTLLVRSHYGLVDALLSERYTVFDDNEVLDCVEDVLAPMNEYSVKNYSINPSMLNLRIVSRNKININGDELSFGFDIKNSGIGKSSVEIGIIIYRWICSNGLIMGGGKGYMLRQRHVAVSRPELITEFGTLLQESPMIIQEIKNSIESSMDMKLNSKEMQRVIDDYKSKGVIANAIGRIEDYVEPQYKDTLWGVTNAVTKLSQDYSLNTRLAMEKAAGIILLKHVA